MCALTLAPIELTLALIKPTVYASQSHVQEIMHIIKAHHFEIVRSRRIFFSPETASAFYEEHQGRFYYPRLVSHLSSGPSLALALASPSAIKDWRTLIGGTKVFKTQWDPKEANSLRTRYGLSDTRNGFHGSDSKDSAREELGKIFEGWDTDWWLANWGELEKVKNKSSGAPR